MEADRTKQSLVIYMNENRTDNNTTLQLLQCGVYCLSTIFFFHYLSIRIPGEIFSIVFKRRVCETFSVNEIS